MVYLTRALGSSDTLEWALYIEEDHTPLSFFHDIPLWADKENHIANMVVEIPRGTTAKLEINKGLEFNPIKQDVKEGKLRHVNYKGGYPFNYGALPQSWEDPSVVDHDTHAKGDNDPIDVCDIGSKRGITGEIRKVKILGVWAMIDAGETDWKILVIDVADPKADKIHNLEDVEREYPGAIATVFEFLQNYKTPIKNQFAFEGQLLDRAKALSVLETAHEQWRRLVQLKQEEARLHKISIYNSRLGNAATVGVEEARKLAKY